MLLGAGHFAKSFPHVIRGPYPNTSVRWVPWFSLAFAIWGSEGLPSHPQVTEHVCGPVSIGFQLCLIPSVSHGSVLLGPWILLGNRERDRIESNCGDFERYTKVPWCFFLSHGNQWRIGSGGGLNAPVWIWDAAEASHCVPLKIHREEGTWPGDTDLGSISTVVSFEVLRVWMTTVLDLEKSWQ